MEQQIRTGETAAKQKTASAASSENLKRWCWNDCTRCV